MHRTEQWSYDTVGRLQTFTNRNGKIQTFGYDALNRMTGFTWNDGGITPSVSFGYDVASRLTGIDNANANITKAYYDDNLIRSETEQILLSGGTSKTVSYAYDADGNRAGMTYPDNSYSFTYGYTGRNQLSSIGGVATYGYDPNGNMTSRDVVLRGSGGFAYDTLDRVNHIAYSFLISGDGYGDDPRPSPTPRPPPDWQSRTFDYDYDSLGNRKWMKREDNSGDVFGYDLNDQLIAGWLDIIDPDITPPGDQSIFYDGSGNRTALNAYESLEGYTINNLNQYTLRNVSGRESVRPSPTPRPRPTPPPRPSPTASPTPPGQQQTATYDYNGNMITGFDGSLYVYDAQNRLLTANKAGTIMSFQYDGLNRQVSRTAPAPPDGPNTGPIFSVWDGWDLIEEYRSGNSVMARYLYGPDGVLKNLTSGNYYYRDGSGSTSYVADGNGNLLEFYLYDLQGTPKFYDGYGNALWDSTLGVRHLFTGQQWYKELGLYDLRNRFYSPDIGRFLQPDPIGFRGDRTNLYRYCRNNPVTRWDPFGLQDAVNNRLDGNGQGGTAEAEEVVVTGSDVPEPIDPGGTGAPSGGGGAGGGGEGRGGSLKLTGITFSYGKPSRNSNSNTQQPPAVMVGFDIYHPTTTAEFIIAGNIIEGGDTTDTAPAIDPIDLLSGGIATLARSSVRRVVQKAAVFWAGGRVAEDAARTFAKANGGTVLADTAVGRALAQSAPTIQTRAQWLRLSQDFARSASGEVNVFQNARGVPLDTMWRNEYEILMTNPNVTWNQVLGRNARRLSRSCA